jgi:hypothetical protein
MNTTTHNKPLGFWLAVVEHRTHDAMRAAFADQGVSRREWRILNALGEGAATADELKSSMPPRGRIGKGHGPRRHRDDRAGRPDHGDRTPRTEGGDRPQRRSTAELLDGLVEKGWATVDDGRYAITESGTRMTAELTERVASVRTKVGAGITDADYATTVATLEAMARNLGWEPRK